MTRIEAIRKAISSEKSHAYCLVIGLAAIVAGTVIRWALAGIAPHLTFVTYYPAILICTLLTGWRYGSACAVLSGITASSMFASPGAAIFPEAAAIAGTAVFLASATIIIATADALRRAVRDLDLANRSAQTLNHELQHRVVNMLTVVQALALQSAKGADADGFISAFTGRLQALAKAHELLGKGKLNSCALPELIDQACEPFCADSNIIKSGPAGELPTESCVPLVLVLHELCTNAVKHGALSTLEGRAELTWTFSESPPRLIIFWKESGGPTVRKPSRRGLGSALLRPQSGITELDLSFDPTGVNCRLIIDGARPFSTRPREAASNPGQQTVAAA